ncbi:MAG: hypothetical protein IJC81_00815 [Clostridia bacterium]|nr:hypothetical protein [Clostridia bacterium]
MEKIKAKPIETLKTVIISVLTVSMLLLAGIYIGGSQFLSNSAAINAEDLPDGAVKIGDTSPIETSLYEKNLLAISFAGIRYGEQGGGTYGNEPAARDMLEFAAEPIHSCLSSSATITVVSDSDFHNMIADNRYIYISLLSPLPYQIVYALTGEYVAAAGSENAISAEVLLLCADSEGKASLCIKSGDKYYLAKSDYSFNLPELSAMALDSRLTDFSIKENGVPLSDTSPHTQTISLSHSEMPRGESYSNLLNLLEYDSGINDTNTSIVAPHGTLLISDTSLLYTASQNSGIELSNFLENSKSNLDIDTYDILLASVSLAEQLRNTVPEKTGGALSLYLDGFYRSDDTYTVVFGIAESNIPIFGDALPYLMRVTVSSGRFKSIDLRFVGAERSGYTVSPFPSRWKYNYASKTNSISSLALLYRADSLDAPELNALWYFIRTKEEVAK